MAVKQETQPKEKETSSERAYRMKAAAFCRSLDRVIKTQNTLMSKETRKHKLSKPQEDELRRRAISELSKVHRSGKSLGIGNFLTDIPPLIEDMRQGIR